jgi:hypothetical protein
MGTGFLSPRVKWPGLVLDHPPPSSAEIEERIELYLFSSSGLLWPVLGQNLPLIFIGSSRLLTNITLIAG